MRKSVILLVTLAASALIAESAWAKTFTIKFADQATVAAACKSVGGNFYNQSGGVYGCGGGGGRSVECNGNTKTCQGTIPRGTQPSRDLRVILSVIAAPAKPSKPGGGILGTGILGSGPGLSNQGPAAAGTPMAPAAPSAPPVIIR